jgi:hypothetical protein
MLKKEIFFSPVEENYWFDGNTSRQKPTFHSHGKIKSSWTKLPYFNQLLVIQPYMSDWSEDSKEDLAYLTRIREQISNNWKYPGC